MPRNVRNFWVELYVDGKKTKIATGPKSSGGGFQLRILMREGGEVSDKVLSASGVVHQNGHLELSAWTSDGDQAIDIFTER